METKIPLDSDDERPLIEVYRSFFPSHKKLVHYSEDIRLLLIEVREKSTKKVIEFVRELTHARMRTEKILLETIKESLGEEIEDDQVLDMQIMLGEFDGSTVEQIKKSAIIQTMIDERRDFIIRVTDYLQS